MGSPRRGARPACGGYTRPRPAGSAGKGAAARIHLIVTARPGYVPRFGDRTPSTRLPLTALSAAESLEMARGLLDAAELPAELHRFIAGKADGNPFCVEEIVRSLREVGAVRRTDTGLVLTRRLDEIGAVCAQSGDVDRGLGLIREALAQYDALGVGFFHTLVMTQLGEACLRADRAEEACGCAERVLALSRERGEKSYEAWALRLLGEAASRRDHGDPGSATGHYGLAMARADELGMRPLVAHCHLGLGTLCHRGGTAGRPWSI